MDFDIVASAAHAAPPINRRISKDVAWERPARRITAAPHGCGAIPAMARARAGAVREIVGRPSRDRKPASGPEREAGGARVRCRLVYEGRQMPPWDSTA